jgi:hypothetical protein
MILQLSLRGPESATAQVRTFQRQVMTKEKKTREEKKREYDGEGKEEDD